MGLRGSGFRGQDPDVKPRLQDRPLSPFQAARTQKSLRMGTTSPPWSAGWMAGSTSCFGLRGLGVLGV